MKDRMRCLGLITRNILTRCLYFKLIKLNILFSLSPLL